jgi:hypothetical protein
MEAGDGVRELDVSAFFIALRSHLIRSCGHIYLPSYSPEEGEFQSSVFFQ